MIRAYQKDANGIIVAVENTYDELGRAKGSSYTVGSKEMLYGLVYKTDSNLVDYISMPTAGTQSMIRYYYDEFDRVIEKFIAHSTTMNYSEEYEYYTYTGADGERHTTSLVSQITFSGNNFGTADVVYDYTYDNLGNITAVYKNGVLAESYEYDSLGQLIREDNVAEDYTVLYVYDKAGNIASKEQFVYSTAPTWHMEALSGTGALTSYTYGNSSWGDLLTSYGGTSISYDAIGNPTNWRNATNLMWEGRELQGITLSGADWLTYSYNSSGIRTKKVFFNNIESTFTTHNYILDGSSIIRESVTGPTAYTLDYLYDASGSATGFIYNNQYYYFQKNLQGDVIRILNSNGAVVTEYTYDAWGNVLTVTGSLASTVGRYNPFRYRSYYYDEETGFYYLQSRYYDPVAGRFLNADGTVGANGGFLGNNLFAYCNNNSTMFSDYSGCARMYNADMTDGGTSPYGDLRNELASRGVPIGDAAYMASRVYSLRAIGDDSAVLLAYDTGSVDLCQSTPKSVPVDYSATMFVIKGLDVVAQFDKCCTMPQYAATKLYKGDLCSAILVNGTYKFTYNSGVSSGTGGYHIKPYYSTNPKLDDVPCVRWSISKQKLVADTATGIYIHRGGNKSYYFNDKIWSRGCILIHRGGEKNRAWYDFVQYFGKTSGVFILYGPNRYILYGPKGT